MQPDNIKIEGLLKYILSVASSEDGFDKELRPIHLLKYVYLVDLDYAFYHQGETYTGITWQFYHYGPWDLNLYRQIEPALLSAGAIRKEIPSKYDKDSISYFFKEELSDDELGLKLDLRAKGSVQHYFRMFGNHTSKLLAFIYNTRPMVNAAPNENLDFKLYMKEGVSDRTELTVEKLTVRQQKKRKQEAQDFRQRIKEKIKNKNKEKALLKPPNSRYDEIYFQGIALIEDEIKSSELEGLKDAAKVSPDIWKSDMRSASENG